MTFDVVKAIVDLTCVRILIEEKSHVRILTLNRPQRLNALLHGMNLIEEKTHVRILTLNRPRRLNALLHNMLIKISTAYEEDSNVKLVILKVFAMPETKFGLFPGNGASYFLSRLPGFLEIALPGRSIDQGRDF
ncbi:hypothetical protein MRB53_025411 [Persea americana]|uniref:Uncharacterized protein n=1 Tax=Persea americana TaxID=3435 RepID=A0ACC2LFQ5_PERAE|nr:hypothetical protein MRB53_025411 [Persea americana]